MRKCRPVYCLIGRISYRVIFAYLSDDAAHEVTARHASHLLLYNNRSPIMGRSRISDTERDNVNMTVESL
jgi:hypothetical protein